MKDLTVHFCSLSYQQDFIGTLTTDGKDQILPRLLSQGRGSLEYAKNFCEDSADPDPRPDPDAETPEWCDCSVCRPMPLDMENVCCRKRTCVTSYTMYQNICLDRDVLTLAIWARFDIMAEEPDYSTSSYRKQPTGNTVYGNMVNWEKETEGFCLRALFSQ